MKNLLSEDVRLKVRSTSNQILHLFSEFGQKAKIRLILVL
jgi:hypothetical protein